MKNQLVKEEKQINLANLITPKVLTALLHENDTVRQGLEKFRIYGYTAVPVLDREGAYIGSVTEGDFLRLICKIGTTDPKEQEKYRIGEIIRRDSVQPQPIEAPVDEVIEAALRQNFVPIVDDRGMFCGIVTRRSLIAYLAKEVL